MHVMRARIPTCVPVRVRARVAESAGLFARAAPQVPTWHLVVGGIALLLALLLLLHLVVRLVRGLVRAIRAALSCLCGCLCCCCYAREPPKEERVGLMMHAEELDEGLSPRACGGGGGPASYGHGGLGAGIELDPTTATRLLYAGGGAALHGPSATWQAPACMFEPPRAGGAY